MIKICNLHLFLIFIISTAIHNKQEKNLCLDFVSEHDQTNELSTTYEDFCNKFCLSILDVYEHDNYPQNLVLGSRSRRIEFFVKKRLSLMSLVTSFNEKISKLDKTEQNIILSFENKIYNEYDLNKTNNLSIKNVNSSYIAPCIRDDLSVVKKQKIDFSDEIDELFLPKNINIRDEKCLEENLDQRLDIINKIEEVEGNVTISSPKIISEKIYECNTIDNYEHNFFSFCKNIEKFKNFLRKSRSLYAINDVFSKKPKNSSSVTKSFIKNVFRRKKSKNKMTKYNFQEKESKKFKFRQKNQKIKIVKQKSNSLDCIYSQVISSNKNYNTYENNLFYQTFDKYPKNSFLKLQEIIEGQNKKHIHFKNICEFWRKYRKEKK